MYVATASMWRSVHLHRRERALRSTVHVVPFWYFDILFLNCKLWSPSPGIDGPAWPDDQVLCRVFHGDGCLILICLFRSSCRLPSLSVCRLSCSWVSHLILCCSAQYQGYEFMAHPFVIDPFRAGLSIYSHVVRPFHHSW